MIIKSLNQDKLNRMAEYIKEYLKTHNGSRPSLINIANYMGMCKSVAYRYLLSLNDQGIINYSGKNTLSIPGSRYECSRSVRLPILGNIACGLPNAEEEYAEGYVAIPEEWVDGDCFLLRTYGDSMIDIGIEPGDLVLVKKAITAPNGKVVVAIIDGQTTLKRLLWDNNKPRLHAENKSNELFKNDIYPKELLIQGIAIKIIKDIK